MDPSRYCGDVVWVPYKPLSMRPPAYVKYILSVELVLHMTDSRAIVLTERGITKLAKPPGLTAAPALLLWNLVRQLPATGQALTLGQVADELGLTRVTVTNAMQELLTAGFIQRGPKVGRVHVYKLNPAFFHHL